MKKIQGLLILSMILLSSCSDYNLSEFQDTAVITERDMRRCACCGGWFIEIGKETKRFYALPEKSFEFSDDQLPLSVQLDWSTDPEACLGDEIIIERIEKL